MAELSGLEVLALVREIDSGLRGTYVNNIYTVGRAQIFRFRLPGGKESWLIASPEFGVWLSEKVSERGETGGFTTKLRQELERGQFVSAEQIDLDRVFVLNFGTKEDERKLVIELLPPGNIILTDGSGRIILAEREHRSAGRRVAKGGMYSPPSQRRSSPTAVTPEVMATAVRREKTAGEVVGRHVSLPGKYVKEVLARLGAEESSPASTFAGRETEVAGVIAGIVEEARLSPFPCLCDTGSGLELLIVRPSRFPVKEEARKLSTLCDLSLFDGVMEGAEEVTPEDRARRELEVTISRLEVEVSSLMDRAAKLRETAKGVVAESEESVLSTLKEAGIVVRGAGVSKGAAASLLYDKGKELEGRAREGSRAIVDLRKKLSKVERTKKRQTKELRRRPQAWYEKFRWFYTSDGKLAIGGRDAQSNSILVKKHVDSNDTVYHADLFGSPFFVLKGGREQTADEVLQVGQATSSFSSAWKTGLAAADAYWVNPDQVSSSAPSGEYLPKGSFMIKGTKNFVPRNLVELAVGVDSEGRLVAGPESAIRNGSSAYVVIRPHREKGSETAKSVAHELKRLTAQHGIDPPSIDDVQRALPAGGGKVVRTKSAGRV